MNIFQGPRTWEVFRLCPVISEDSGSSAAVRVVRLPARVLGSIWRPIFVVWGPSTLTCSYLMLSQPYSGFLTHPHPSHNMLTIWLFIMCLFVCFGPTGTSWLFHTLSPPLPSFCHLIWAQFFSWYFDIPLCLFLQSKNILQKSKRKLSKNR